MALRQIGEAAGALAQRQRADQIVADAHVACGREQAGERAQQRRLAGAVRPDHGGETAARQRERDVVHHHAPAERDAQALGREIGAHATPPPSERRSRTIR